MSKLSMGTCKRCGKAFVKHKANDIVCDDPVCKAMADERKNALKALYRAGMQAADTGPGSDLPPKRVCHDCGRPTNNYRCPECWARRKAGEEFSDDAAEEYSISYETRYRS